MTRVALLGFGTVGSSVARRLTEPAAGRPILTHIFDRRAADKRASFRSSSPLVWTSRIEDILQSNVDIVVEALGGIDPAADWIRAALASGKSVVTANKQLVASHGDALWTLASRHGRQFRFEAAVGGAMPIVRAVADGLAGDRLTRIDAILNGTTNAVLSEMEATGCALAAALARARASGWAEADPSQDLDGDDARAKLSILSALAFGIRVAPADIAARSAASISSADFAAARRANATIRQIAHARLDRERRTLTAWVSPIAVPRDSLFARAVGPQNAAVLTGEHSGQVGMFGIGAGGGATAVAIVSDVLAIARDRAAIVPPPALTSDFTVQTSDFEFQTSNLELPTSDFDFAEAV